VFTTLTLRDGRTLEYAEFGDPSGIPAVLFHGTPGSAAGGAIVADAASASGVRLVAPSRPGYGESTFSPPGLAASVPDTLELADHLGLERFAVLGTSGGGPFALAVAAVAPDRVTSVSVLAGPGVYAEVKPEVLGDDDRRALALAADGDVDGAMTIMNGLGDAFLGKLRHLPPAEFAAALATIAPPGETWLDRHPDLKVVFQADFQRAITTTDGFSRDNLSWLGDWDFDLDAVTAPVRLVYGDSDGMSPLVHGEWLHARLPNSELHIIPGGHGDATFGAAADAFKAIASA
jgi:pimeloyl-ACP methyl ester carboxylesterase